MSKHALVTGFIPDNEAAICARLNELSAEGWHVHSWHTVDVPVNLEASNPYMKQAITFLMVNHTVDPSPTRAPIGMKMG